MYAGLIETSGEMNMRMTDTQQIQLLKIVDYMERLPPGTINALMKFTRNVPRRERMYAVTFGEVWNRFTRKDAFEEFAKSRAEGISIKPWKTHASRNAALCVAGMADDVALILKDRRQDLIKLGHGKKGEIALRSHGQEVRIAHWLTNEERYDFVKELRASLKRSRMV